MSLFFRNNCPTVSQLMHSKRKGFIISSWLDYKHLSHVLPEPYSLSHPTPATLPSFLLLEHVHLPEPPAKSTFSSKTAPDYTNQNRKFLDTIPLPCFVFFIALTYLTYYTFAYFLLILSSMRSIFVCGFIVSPVPRIVWHIINTQ